jgi:hypothetical protein
MLKMMEATPNYSTGLWVAGATSEKLPNAREEIAMGELVMERIMLVPLFLASAMLSHASANGKSEQHVDAPKEVQALVGTYTGSWTMYGIDDKQQIIKKMAWTDTMKAVDPVVKDGRAMVTTTDEMRFEGSKAPPFKVQGNEGYYLTKDGGLGDYFIETYGQVNRMVKLSDNVMSYAAPAVEQDLMRLGFPKGASGQHVLVKVVLKEQGVETHRISRLTTVTWKDMAGKELALQFVSLQGCHQRQP